MSFELNKRIREVQIRSKSSGRYEKLPYIPAHIDFTKARRIEQYSDRLGEVEEYYEFEGDTFRVIYDVLG